LADSRGSDALGVSAEPVRKMIEQQSDAADLLEVWVHDEPDLSLEHESVSKDRDEVRIPLGDRNVASRNSHAGTHRRDLHGHIVGAKSEIFTAKLGCAASGRPEDMKIPIKAN
jgi:hypothetical protein